MKPIDPLKFDSLSDYIRVRISKGRKQRKGPQGGLRVMGAKNPFIREPKPCYRRAIIKSIVIKNTGSRWHFRRQDHAAYLQRDGTSIDGSKTTLYDKHGIPIDVEKYLSDSASDPHEFRFIISPEDANQIDLKEFTLKFMSRMEKELRTSLEWIAANHYNTDKPHTHLTMRGVDQLGNRLILDPDFISHGMRNIAREILTNELGERTDLEIQNEVLQSLHNQRVTQLDQTFEWMASNKFSRTIHIANDVNLSDVMFDAKVQTERLQFLEKFGLTKEVSAHYWLIHSELISKLKEMGIQGDIIKMMHRESRSIEDRERIIYDPILHGEIRGKVSVRGVANELTDQEYIIVESEDGKAYFVRLNYTSERQKCIVGDVVDVNLKPPGSAFGKRVEKILELANANNGIYDPAKHLEWAETNLLFSETKIDKGPKDYVANFEKQVAKLENLGMLIKQDDGTCRVVENVREKMVQIDEERVKNSRPSVEVKIVDTELSQDGTKRLINGEEYTVYNLEEHGKGELKGTVLFRGVNMRGNDYITLKTSEEKLFYVELPKFCEWEKSQKGDSVRIRLEKQSFFKKSDYNIFKCANENKLVYDRNFHFEWSKNEGNSPLLGDTLDHEREEYVERHVKRMKLLERFALVEPIEEGKWKVVPDFNKKMAVLRNEQEERFEPSLRVNKEAQVRGQVSDSILRTRLVDGKEAIVFEKEAHRENGIRGRVIGKGVLEEQANKPFILVEAKDKTRFLVPVTVSDNNRINRGDSIKIGLGKIQRFFKKSDLNIDAFARNNGGVYDSQAHFAEANSKYKLPENRIEEFKKNFIENHQKRLKFLENFKLVTPTGYEKWNIDKDFLEKMKALEKQHQFSQPVQIEVVSSAKYKQASQKPLTVEDPKEETLRKGPKL